MDMVRIGVIGVGGMGSAHARHLFAGGVNGAVLAALCDIDAARCEQLKELFPAVPVYEEAEDLFAAGVCDAVVIATPHYFHPIIGVQAFEHGLHVLSEKPMAVQTSEARRLIAAADKSGRAFCVMFNQRTDPLFQKARELVQSGVLGELKRFHWIITNWYRTQAYYDSGAWRATFCGEGGGVLMNQAPHNLDLWQWICGMPDRISARCPVAKYHNIEVEDEALIIGEYDSGLVALFQTTTGEYPGTNRLEITGDGGKMVLEDGKLKLWRLKEREREVCFAAKEGFVQIPMDYEEQTFEAPTNPHGAVLQNFVDHILTGVPLLSDGREALNEVMLCNAAYLSAWQGRMTALPVDAAAFDRELALRCERSAMREAGSAPMHDGYQPRWQVRW